MTLKHAITTNQIIGLQNYSFHNATACNLAQKASISPDAGLAHGNNS